MSEKIIPEKESWQKRLIRSAFFSTLSGTAPKIKNQMNDKFKLTGRVEFIKEICQEKKVLHLGCTNYPYTREAIENKMLLHFELQKISREIYGFDFDRAGIDILEKEHGAKNLFRADLEKLDEVELNETFDVIIAGEIIEHLNNPGLFLNGIKRFMNENTDLVITTVNAYCAMRFWIYGLRGKSGENEPVHPDHVAYYSYSTIKLLLDRHNLAVKQFLFYNLGKEHRPHTRWYYKLCNDISVKIAPQWADGIIAVCGIGKN